jgi:hypothetical protein
MAQDQPPPSQPDPPENSAAESQTGMSPEQSEAPPQVPTAPDRSQGPRLTFRPVALRLLRGTIQVLEQAIDRLEVTPSPAETAQSSLLQAPREALGKILGLGFARLQALGLSLRDQIRSRLPASLNQKLSDPALAGVVAGIFLLSLWTVSALAPSSRLASPPVSIAPSPPIPPTIPVAPSPVIPTITAPEQSAPAIPAPVETVAPVATPQPMLTPSLGLNPPPPLIASIQTQVAEITDQFADGLIQSVEANFQGSRLILRVRDGWYALGVAEQDQLAAETLQRSQDLDFRTLHIVDETNQLVARSPVVGTTMVILKRHPVPID